MRHPTAAHRCIPALAACLLLGSCFTSSLWGFEERTDAGGGTRVVLDEDNWDRDDLAWYWRVLLTPLTITADVVTLCFQAWLFDDHDEPCAARGRGC